MKTLLQNGRIVDGTGSPGYIGNVLLDGDRIAEVSAGPIAAEAVTVDCTGRVIAPGFLDMHSHMDWILPIEGRPDLKTPFTAQGCTTFVAGNCGFAPAGLLPDSPHRGLLTIGGALPFALEWHGLDQYFDRLTHQGLSHNLVELVGHGTSIASIRGFEPRPPSAGEMQTLLGLLEDALDQGAAGVSLGLMYEPGIHARDEDLIEIARLVRRKDKIVTVHGRALSALSMAYPLDAPKPHNVLAIEDMVRLARETGVRLQYSHLMLAGTSSHPTYRQCLDTIEAARDEGVDIMTDTYPYHCGNSIINVILPPWFLAGLPANYHDADAIKRLEEEISFTSAVLGFGYNDIQIAHAGHPELNQYNGMFLDRIAEKTGRTPFEVMLEISEKTGGMARVLNHNYSNMEVIDALMAHPAVLFMTDTVVCAEGGVQNPATYGAFPLLLQYARERKAIGLEEAVRKMTGGSALRFGVKDRGLLQPGMAADVTVFDWDNVRDNTTTHETDRAPSGIDYVFINGRQVLARGKVDETAAAGRTVCVV